MSEQELDDRIRAFLDRKLERISKPSYSQKVWNSLKSYFTYTPVRTTRFRLLK